ncbi:hypothetical protein B296_00056440, partial [Ensete ventricosum]
SHTISEMLQRRDETWSSFFPSPYASDISSPLHRSTANCLLELPTFDPPCSGTGDASAHCSCCMERLAFACGFLALFCSALLLIGSLAHVLASSHNHFTWMTMFGNHFHSIEPQQLPPGFRFHPTDEELIAHYLLQKALDSSFTSRAIAEVDLHKCEPWELPGQTQSLHASLCSTFLSFQACILDAEKAKMGEEEWYFFSLRDRKYPTGLRTNRATGAGYWKATGKDKEIYSTRTKSLVGMKKTLVFYRGRAPKGEKSNWVMHEYRLEGRFAFHFLCGSSKVCLWLSVFSQR